MGMVGLRDVFVVAPAGSFSTHQHQQHGHESINLGGSDQVHEPNPTALGVGVGVIPLLTAAPCLGPPSQNMDDHLDLLNSGRNCGKINQGIQFWQNQSSGFNLNSNNNNNTNSNNNCVVKKVTLFDQTTSSPHNLLQSGSNVAFISGGNSGSSSGATTCQDCGNQAKKDCSHRRCRTCCRSRGFDCTTHVKSTWVPATRRRERQLMAATAAGSGGGGGCGSSGATSGVKKPRLVTSQTTTTSHTSTSNTTPRSFDTSSSHQDASFKESLPGQVIAQAVFKCVKVTSVDDGEDEFAYQASVKIGGHIFKGFLYDQGIDHSSSSRDALPNLSELHLAGATSGSGANAAAPSSSSPLLDQTDVYATSGSGANAFLGGGSSYGNNPLN